MPQTVLKQTAAGAAANRASRVRPSSLRTVTLQGVGTSRHPDMIGESFAHSVCAVTNPFCDGSRNSKWPDQSAAQTLAIPVRMRYNMTTDANGSAGTIFTSIYPKGILPGEMTGTVWGTTGATQSYAPAFTAADQYRVVSAGVKVTPITSAMNSQGVINVIELPPADLASQYENTDTATKNYPSYDTLPLKSEQSIFAVMRPSGATAREFRDTETSTGLNESTGDWTSIMVNITGAAAFETVAIVDIFVNLEVTFGVTSELGYLTTKAPPPSLAITNASTAIVQSTAITKGTDRSVDQGFMSRAMSYARSAGGFLLRNGENIKHLVAAGGMAYAGQPAAAAGQLMLLDGRKIIDVD